MYHNVLCRCGISNIYLDLERVMYLALLLSIVWRKNSRAVHVVIQSVQTCAKNTTMLNYHCLDCSAGLYCKMFSVPFIQQLFSRQIRVGHRPIFKPFHTCATNLKSIQYTFLSVLCCIRHLLRKDIERSTTHYVHAAVYVYTKYCLPVYTTIVLLNHNYLSAASCAERVDTWSKITCE